ncbi:hypothetical protein MMC21_008342 [Puttea exsequens]|nr:hypothetical protein [Puttea exsequens]
MVLAAPTIHLALSRTQLQKISLSGAIAVANEQNLLKSQPSTVSALSNNSSSFDPSPSAELDHPYSYYSVSALGDKDIFYAGSGKDGDIGENGHALHGLGIEDLKQPAVTPVRRSNTTNTQPATDFLSLPDQSHTPKYHVLDSTPWETGETDVRGQLLQTTLYSPANTTKEDSTPCFGSSIKAGFESRPWTDDHFPYRTQRGLQQGKISRALILSASVWFPMFSGLWLALADSRPHYRPKFRPDGPVLPTIATTLFTAFAKGVELTFVIVVVTFISQMLGQRACKGGSNGISIAEMQLRNWA